MTRRTLSRRCVLAAAVAGLAFPRVAFAQTVMLQDITPMRIRLAFADQDFTATLGDNPTARDFQTRLPLDLKIEDYGSHEKIAYLPKKLTQTGAGPIDTPLPGDICYFAPWGNLAMYHGGYSNYPGLIRLGKLDAGPTPLLTRGTFALRITALT